IGVDNCVANSLSQLGMVGIVLDDDHGRLAFSVDIQMPLDTNNGLLAFGDRVDALYEARSPVKRSRDNAAQAKALLAVAAKNDVGTELIDCLPNDAAAFENFDGGFNFVL